MEYQSSNYHRSHWRRKTIKERPEKQKGNLAAIVNLSLAVSFIGVNLIAGSNPEPIQVPIKEVCYCVSGTILLSAFGYNFGRYLFKKTP
ncbi:MAG TPA: hypothetical protein VJB89_02035 [Candidatus Nanoarchaeia archaeon]|nr:hypothetical protein [Candidatus Nanoarchaeia archaeon]